MTKRRGKAGRRATAAGRKGPQARKSSASKAAKSGLRKPKPAARKQKPVAASQTVHLKRQLQAARRQQQATAEILRAVANAAGDAARPLQFIAETTARLFGAQSVSIQLAEGIEFTQEYRVGSIARRVGSAYPRSNIKVGGRNLPGTVVAESRQIHIPDLDRLDPSMSDFPGLPHARAGGARTVCGTPLRRDGKAIGALIVFRDELLPFTGDELALLQTFADQAVIAIENARLFNETRETLERQTATADILRVISVSPTDVQPVFNALVLTARRLLRREMAFILLCEGGTTFRPVAITGPQGLIDIRNPEPILIDPQANFPSRAIVSKAIQHFPDWSVIALPEQECKIQETCGLSSALYLPMLRGGECIGVLGLGGKQAGNFNEADIALAKSFCDQALIAIENARLFNETNEALERQTATADILKVIASSPSDVQPVFEAIATSANRLVGGFSTAVHLVIDDVVHLAAFTPTTAEADKLLVAAHPRHRSEVAAVPLVENGETAQIADSEAADAHTRQLGRARGWRSVTLTPLMNQGSFIGFIACTRRETGVLAEHHVQLLRTFADQAVIAIENVRLFDEVQARTDDLTESLQQQTATADVLKVISRSAFDLQSVFDTLARSAADLCAVSLCGLHIREGDVLVCRGYAGGSKEQQDFVRQTRIPLNDANYFMTHVLSSGEVANITDFDNATLRTRAFQEVLGFKALLMVPLMREGQGIGLFVLGRDRVGAFSQRHIELVQTFADQAVIAIENARLFEEVQARTADLTESLQQQTATADVLKVISRSAFDLDSVMNTLTRSAAELCKAEFSALYLRDGDLLFARGMAGVDGARLDFLRNTPLRIDDSGAGRALQTGSILNMADVERDGTETTRRFGKAIGFNSILFVPLMREGRGIGVFALGRECTGKYSQREVELLQTFADQAVIAIENVRLFDETQEALEQQRASASVLSAISNSVADTQPVFDEILRSIAHLYDVEERFILLTDEDETLRIGAVHGPNADRTRDLFPVPLKGSATEIAIRERRLVLHDDVLNGADVPPVLRETARRFGRNYSMATVPMLWEDRAIGSIVVGRMSMKRFTEKECSLLRTFADQAVIAIQNARLFNETREALERQTATADILKVIASSPSDVQPVFEAIAERSNRLIGGLSTAVHSIVDDVMHLMAFTRINPEADAVLRASFPRPLSEAAWGDRIRNREIVEIPDAQAEWAEEPRLRDVARLRGFRSLLFVPLLRDGVTIGLISVTRRELGRFAPHHVQLLQTFADQAVIAIANVELFKQVQQRTLELSQSLDDLRTAQDRLVQTEKLASLGQLTAGIAHEIKNPLNFVNNFAALSAELVAEMTEVFDNSALDEAGRRKELDEIRDLLKGNLEKVVQHGKRADSIVKNMLLHSREGSGERRASDLNALVSESLNLAYHGARAERSDFNITLEQDLDPAAGSVEVYPQELTRALLNLISNGFYAAIRRKMDGGGATFEPVLSAATKNAGPAVEIRIRDNGTGIPADIREKIFNPFFTTKPTGEGTGLGLSMTHDIIVKQHGGRLDVETEPGAFTEFIITLPRETGNGAGRKSE